MTTSKQLVKADMPNIADYFGMNAEMLKMIIAEAIKQNKIQELLGIQKMETGETERRYYLVKRPSKKSGFIYQLKVIDPETKKILPTKFSTGTNDLNTAIQWAEKNIKSCLANYHGKCELSLLDSYYSDTNACFQYEKYDGRKLSPEVMKSRQGFMSNHIVKFLQSQNVRYLSQITPIHIRELKNYLTTEKHLKPQTINYNMNSFKKCLAVFKDMGKITTDFSTCSFIVKGSKKAVKSRGIYSIDALKGVFNQQWESGLSKLLCMVIYFTGIRNSELLRMRFNDIEKIQDVYFLNVNGTKSKNAKRKVPIHPMLYTALENYVKENGIENGKLIFDGVYNDTFRKASFDMGSVMGFNEKQLIEKGICFYSGRHTMKRLLKVGNGEKVGDVGIHIQEMLMGHTFKKEKVDAEGINEYEYGNLNTEIIGDSLLVKKGKEVIKILSYYYL
jgi:integrase